MREKTLAARFKAEFRVKAGEPIGWEEFWGTKFPLYEWVDLRELVMALVKELGYKVNVSKKVTLTKIKKDGK